MTRYRQTSSNLYRKDPAVRTSVHFRSAEVHHCDRQPARSCSAWEHILRRWFWRHPVGAPELTSLADVVLERADMTRTNTQSTGRVSSGWLLYSEPFCPP